jgi:hypothetical protein|tara:strand:+ start:884 stop:1108 length:225 start_codon:yes stop_codon:yes gene_type:complete
MPNFKEPKNELGAFKMSAAQKKIAELAGNPNKIEAADFAVLRKDKSKKKTDDSNVFKAQPADNMKTMYYGKNKY